MERFTAVPDMCVIMPFCFVNEKRRIGSDVSRKGLHIGCLDHQCVVPRLPFGVPRRLDVTQPP
jgi:hypothetical protein